MNDLDTLSIPRSTSADLLMRRMAMLHLEPADLAVAEPLLMGEFRRLCAMCESKGRCARSLADEFSDPAWQDWRDYCPNATILTVMSTLRDCRSGDHAACTGE
jgi:hypothetical protein